MAKYLDGTGLSKAFELIKSWVTTNFLTDVSYDSTSKKIQKTKNGTTSDVVALATVATSGSYNDLSNKPTIPSGVSPYDSDPEMDGTKSPGESDLFARGDHVHPTDTSRAANTDFVGSRYGGLAGTHGLVPAPPAKTGDQIGNKYFLLDDGYWHGGWMDLYFDSTIGDEGEYVLRVRYMQSDGQTQATLWSATLPAVTSTTRGMMRASDKSHLDTLWNSGDYQSDWGQSDSTAADYIKNKPTIPTVPGDFTGATSNAAGAHGLVPAPASGNQNNVLFGNGNWKPLKFAWNYDDDYVVYLVRKESANTHTVLDSMTLQLANSGGTNHHGLMSSTDKINLDALVAAGPEANVQSDWNQTTTTADDYIKNKPTLGTAAAKNVGSVADGSTGLVTGDAVYDAIQDALSDVAGALVYNGTAATASAISGTSYKKGWYWIASDTFALTSSINVEPGDMIIAKQDKTSTFANDIDVVQTNIETLTTAEVTALWNAA